MPEIQAAFSELGAQILGHLTPGEMPVGTVFVKEFGDAEPVPGYASGTTNAAPGWHMVGENGPELAFFRGGETVLNAHDTATALAPGDTTVNLTVVVNADGAVAGQSESFWDDVGGQFERRVRDVLEDIAEDRRRRSY